MLNSVLPNELTVNEVEETLIADGIHDFSDPAHFATTEQVQHHYLVFVAEALVVLVLHGVPERIDDLVQRGVCST